MSDPPEIIGLLAHVMGDVLAVGKHETNTTQHFNFRGIDAVLNAVGPALRRHRVVVLPTVLRSDVTSVEVGSKHTRMAHVTLRVRYRFYAEDGSSVDAVVPAEAFDAGDKAVSKAMSVAYRTCLIQALSLPTTEPDPDSVSYERAPGMDPDDMFDQLRLTTKTLADPSPVVDWVKDAGITRGSLTPELAEEWADRIAATAAQAAPVEPVPDPF